jgi:cellulose biosynthesis protein BcsQ
MNVVATYSIKGGVGKTTAAVNLAYEAAATGARVLLWDLDPQGAATFLLRVKPFVKGGAQRLAGKKGALQPHLHGSDHAGLHVVPADFSLRHLDRHLDRHLGDAQRSSTRLRSLLDPIAGNYDLAVLDCPPGITLTSESVFAAVDALVVPTIPATLSRRTLDQLTRFLADLDQPPMVLPFGSMVDRRKKLQRDVVAELIASVPAFLPTLIPNSSIIERMGVERAPVGVYAPTSSVAAAFRDLWSDISDRLCSA